MKRVDKLLERKIKGMLWDLTPEKREILTHEIKHDPIIAFHDDQIFIRSLNSLSWYDLIQLLGTDNLILLLTDDVISKLYPQSRQIYYKNAKELLSKYTVPPAR